MRYASCVLQIHGSRRSRHLVARTSLADALRHKTNARAIARERIWSEFKRILLGRHASEIVQRMADDGILKQILDLDWEQEDVRIKLLNELEGSDVIDRLVVLLRDFSSRSVNNSLRGFD